MIEFISLLILYVITVGFLGFLYLKEREQSQKQIKELYDQMKTDREMMMAGGLQEYKNIKDGFSPPKNEIADEPNSDEITENSSIPIEEITAIQIDDQPKRKVKIYK